MVLPFTPPDQSNDSFDIDGTFFGGGAGTSNSFVGSNVPGSSGLSTRQGMIQNNRPAVSTRQIIHWLLPEGPIVQMYINPQNISYNYKKTISSQRTKGGYALQYWGPELTILNISGTTGTSGIEGINVLYDIYNNEQIAFDPFALFLSAKLNQERQTQGLFAADSAFNESADFIGSLLGTNESLLPQGVTQAPSLASLAFTVEMYWSGEVYRGYFTDFTIKESVDQLGLFNYDINFTVTQKRGFRHNFLAWQRDPTKGPSNSDPELGVPFSYGSLVGKEQATPQVESVKPSSTVLNQISSSFGINGF